MSSTWAVKLLKSPVRIPILGMAPLPRGLVHNLAHVNAKNKYRFIGVTRSKYGNVCWVKQLYYAR